MVQTAINKAKVAKNAKSQTNEEHAREALILKRVRRQEAQKDMKAVKKLGFPKTEMKIMNNEGMPVVEYQDIVLPVAEEDGDDNEEDVDMIATDGELVSIQAKSFEERMGELQERVTGEYMKWCKVMKEEEMNEIMRDEEEGSDIEDAKGKGVERMEMKRRKRAKDHKTWLVDRAKAEWVGVIYNEDGDIQVGEVAEGSGVNEGAGSGGRKRRRVRRYEIE